MNRTFAPRRVIYLVVLLLLLTGNLQAQEKKAAPGKITEWSLVYQLTYLKTVAGNTYTVHSIGPNFTFRNGWRVPLISSTTIFIPLAISNDGVWHSGLGEFYSSRVGIEQIIGFELTGPLGDQWRWRGAPAWSLNGISMTGETGYYSFQSLTTGPALLFGFDRDWEQGLTIRITAAVTYQFVDLIHSANKLDYGITGHLGIGIGFKPGAAFTGRYSDEG
jgi:hypothetical protein